MGCFKNFIGLSNVMDLGLWGIMFVKVDAGFAWLEFKVWFKKCLSLEPVHWRYQVHSVAQETIATIIFLLGIYYSASSLTLKNFFCFFFFFKFLSRCC